MSICLDTNTVLTSTVGTTTVTEPPAPSSALSGGSAAAQAPVAAATVGNSVPVEELLTAAPIKNVAKLLVANHHAVGGGVGTPVKVNSPLITVLNPTGPITVVKSICVNPGAAAAGGSSSAANAGVAPQFTVVNSAPLTVTGPNLGKAITLLSAAPVTMVKSMVSAAGLQQQQQQQQQQNMDIINSSSISSTGGCINKLESAAGATTTNINIISNNNNSCGAVAEKVAPVHNIYVKNAIAAATMATDLVTQEVCQAQKLLTCNAFPQVVSNVVQAATAKTANGQRPVPANNKVKILGGTYVIPNASAGPSNNNIILNKTTAVVGAPVSQATKCIQQLPQQNHQNPGLQRHQQQQQQKFMSNGAAPKFLSKPSPNNTVKAAAPPPPPPIKANQLQQQRLMYPTHKSQIKTLPPVVNNYPPKTGIKTLSPQTKNIPGQVQRTGSGLRTIPPQRPQKMPNKPNYIGKHAVQANKIKNLSQGPGRINKNLKGGAYSGLYQQNHPTPPQSNQVTFNQALTAEILETLGHGGGSTSNSYPGNKSVYEMAPSRYENTYSYSEKISSDLPARAEEKTQQSSLDTLSLICQAVLLDHNYNATPPPDSPPRSAPPSNVMSHMNGVSNSLYSPGSGGRSTLVSSNTLSSLSTSSLLPSNSSSVIQDDDAASDISCVSERKHDTEGEETDTAPEAEAVKNDDQFDHYGDYVTRCICDFIHDDGYMIECDKCKVWQHVRCVVRSKQVPDEYLCEVCDPTKPFDRQKARFLQQQWMRDGQFAEAKLRKEAKLKEQLKMKEMLSDSDSSEVENSGNNNNLLNKGRTTTTSRKNESLQRQGTTRQKSTKEASNRRPLKRKERKITKRKQKAQPKAAPHNSDDEQENNSWTSSQLPQLRQWIENYEEAVTNHYSPELRARISAIRINGAHSDLTTQMDPSVNRCRIHTQPLTGIKYLVSTVSLAPNTPVVELRGKYMLSTQHRNSGGGSLTTRQHAQRPGPFLFFYRLQKDNTEVCVDTRTYGNSARFIRRSCKPNAELRHCIEKGVLHLYIVTITAVDKNLELTIKHESHDLAVIGSTHIACACGKPDECAVNRGANAAGNNNNNNTHAITAPASTGGGKKNGDTSDNHRKRRGRRTVSQSEPELAQKPVQEPSPVVTPVKKELEAELKVKIEPPEEKEQEKENDKEKEKAIKVEVKKEEPAEIPTLPSPLPSPSSIKAEIKKEAIKKEEKVKVKVKVEVTEEEEEEEEETEKEEEEGIKEKSPSKLQHQQQTPPSRPAKAASMRRSSSHNKSGELEDKKGEKEEPPKDDKKNKKLSREERKLEAIMKAFERMERQQQRKQEHQAKQAHRRESEPGPNNNNMTTPKEENESKVKRRRRKGRARTVSTNSQNSRRNRLNSAESSYATSGDENLLSPNDGGVGGVQQQNRFLLKENEIQTVEQQNSPSNKAAGLLLAIANGENGHNSERKSPPPHDIMDSNSNSAHSSPETPLSSACLLVAAAVEPLEPGFKFPKTKKGLMNEWLNKSPDLVQPASSISPSSLTPHVPVTTEFDSNTGYYAPTKNLAALAQAATFCDSTSSRGNAKKRWLRQAISEDQCDSPSSRPESPPAEMVAPPKKRRLPRESLSAETSPPTTPTGSAPQLALSQRADGDLKTCQEGGCVEIVHHCGADSDSPTQTLESDAVLKERAAEMQQEFGSCIRLPAESGGGCRESEGGGNGCRESESGGGAQRSQPPPPSAAAPMNCIMDPRLAAHHDRLLFSNSDHLVGAVEKTLSILGFENRKVESLTPTKRKLSITEYRQRKKLSVNDKLQEESIAEESSSQEMTSKLRPRSNSSSSTTSFMSSDDEGPPLAEINEKVLSAFNSEPTELERQRENLGIRLKKTFGLSIDDEHRKTAINVETLLNCELNPPVKPSVPLSSPTFPIPGSCDPQLPTPPAPPPPSEAVAEEINKSKTMATVAEQQQQQQEIRHDEDDGSGGGASRKEASKPPPPPPPPPPPAEVTNYVPPFNNPVYPNNNFASYGSVIDDDVPYEGRNPSPPPDL